MPAPESAIGSAERKAMQSGQSAGGNQRLEASGRREAAFDGRPLPLPGVRGEAPSGDDGVGLWSDWGILGCCYIYWIVVDSQGLALSVQCEAQAQNVTALGRKG